MCESVSTLQRTMESRFSKLEDQLTALQTTIVDQVLQTSTQEQHYFRTLAGVLQRDVDALRDTLTRKNVSSEEVLKSVIDFNKSLMKQWRVKLEVVCYVKQKSLGV